MPWASFIRTFRVRCPGIWRAPHLFLAIFPFPEAFLIIQFRQAGKQTRPVRLDAFDTYPRRVQHSRLATYNKVETIEPLLPRFTAESLLAHRSFGRLPSRTYVFLFDEVNDILAGMGCVFSVACCGRTALERHTIITTLDTLSCGF